MHGCARGICAAALAHILIHINPAVVKAFLQDLAIVIAQRIEGIIDRLLCLGKGNLLIHIRQQRRIQVIEMELVHTQKLLTKADIAMHLVKILVNCFDQIQVNRGRNLRPEQGCFESILILPGFREELQLLVLRVQKRCGSVLEAAEGMIEVFVGALAKLSVSALFQADKGTLAERVLLAIAVYCIGESNIGVGKGAVSLTGSSGNLTGGSQQLFLCGREGMLLHTATIGQIPAVALQLRTILVELIQPFIRNRHDFGSLEAAGSVQRNHHAHKFTGHRLIGSVAGILIGFAHAVVGKQRNLYIHLLHNGEIVKQGLAAFFQPTGKTDKLRLVFSDGRQFLLPSFVGSEQVFCCPLIFLGNFFTGTDLLDLFHSITSC